VAAQKDAPYAALQIADVDDIKHIKRIELATHPEPPQRQLAKQLTEPLQDIMR